MKKQNKEDVFRKQKDLKVVRAFVYKGLYDKKNKNHLNIEIIDKKTNKIFVGNLAHYGDFAKLKTKQKLKNGRKIKKNN